MQKNLKINKFKVRKVSDLEKIPLHLKKEQQNRITDISYPKPVFLKSINGTDAYKIIEKYNNFRLCDECLKVGKLVDVHNISEFEVVCIEHGHTFSVEE